MRIGAHVKPGDILVGKITPKGETELSPEEKLLTAIFGEKAKDVKDSSLKVLAGHGRRGHRREDLLAHRGLRWSRRTAASGSARCAGSRARRSCASTRCATRSWRELLEGQTVALALKSGTVEEAIPAGTKLTPDVLGEHALRDARPQDVPRREQEARTSAIRTIIDAANEEKARIEEKAEERIDRILQPDELPPGVIQLVKVYLAEKRKISVGDKMAGRHGNKGIVARIVPEEDMPFLPDGRPVDIVLNPLGVPSRMNVGQILETHLGWAAKILGFYAKTPVFQGANEREIGLLLKLAGAHVVGAGAGAAHVGAGDHRRRRPQAIAGPEAGPHRRCRTSVGPAAGRDAQRPRRRAAMSAETRDVFNRVRDFLAAAARELARARAGGARAPDSPAHGDGGGRGGVGGRASAEAKAPCKQLEKRRALDAGGRCCASRSCRRWPAMLGKKSEADVDAAARGADAPRGHHAGRQGATCATAGRARRSTSPVTVGEIYMLKLSHLVDDKIHARSIGPYSLVTQQPLAGKAQFGGQRFGEMEVWALEAYGAAHTLQEILTVKSDDVNGRSRVYEAIVKGQNLPEPGIPESFNVLVKELQALGIKVTLGPDARMASKRHSAPTASGNGTGARSKR